MCAKAKATVVGNMVTLDKCCADGVELARPFVVDEAENRPISRPVEYVYVTLVSRGVHRNFGLGLLQTCDKW